MVGADKKYYFLDNIFVKRTLRKAEWNEDPDGFVLEPSAALPQRFRNDAAIQQYLRKHTNIPLPSFATTFEDDGAVYLIEEFVDGVEMKELPDDDKLVVLKELQQHLTTIKSLRSDTLGVPGGEDLLVAPVRLINYGWHHHTCWRPRANIKGDFVLCHNDLGQHNVLVDPKSLKIKAIIDWEFGGFWPAWFERAFWTRPGHSYGIEGEEDDIERCREWLLANFVPVEPTHPLSLQEKLATFPSISLPPSPEGLVNYSPSPELNLSHLPHVLSPLPDPVDKQHTAPDSIDKSSPGNHSESEPVNNPDYDDAGLVTIGKTTISSGNGPPSSVPEESS